MATTRCLVVQVVVVVATACSSPSLSAGRSPGMVEPAGSAEQGVSAAEVNSPAASEEPSADPSVPLVAEWEVVGGQEQGRTGTIALRLRIERRTRWPLPISIQVAVPSGVRVLRGETQVELGVSEEPGVAYVDFELAVDSVPQEDLVAIVDSRSSGAGLHAEPHYRFGRPDPAETTVPTNGPRLQVGGHDLGPGVLLE